MLKLYLLMLNYTEFEQIFSTFVVFDASCPFFPSFFWQKKKFHISPCGWQFCQILLKARLFYFKCLAVQLYLLSFSELLKSWLKVLRALFQVFKRFYVVIIIIIFLSLCVQLCLHQLNSIYCIECYSRLTNIYKRFLRFNRVRNW